MRKTAFITLFILLFTLRVSAQLEDRFSYLLETDLAEYAKPAVTSLGVGLNSAGYHDAYVSKLFGFSIGVRAMFIFIPDDQLTFKPVGLPDGYSADKETATIWGEKGAVYPGPLGYVTYPGGLNVTTVPLAYPQASVSMLGTEIMIRYLPEIDLGDSGESLSLFGFGIKHSISQYIPLLPVNIAVQFLYNKLSVTNVMESKNIAFNVHASKSFGLFSLYGGLQYETSTTEFTYVFEDPNNVSTLDGTEISSTIDGDNNIRLTVGAAFTAAFFVINADYSIGSQSVVTTGISFEF